MRTRPADRIAHDGAVHATQQEKAAAFRALHEGETFIIPNPWDAGSAKVLAALGFKALASTSSGFAWTLGRRDNHITLEQCLDWLRAAGFDTDSRVINLPPYHFGLIAHKPHATRQD